ncbi:hypothetical protein BH10BAC2_BH10BAC2_23000 [soil metagenome]
MKKSITTICVLVVCFAFNNCIVQAQSSQQNNTFMVRHSVIFKLKHPKDSPEGQAFFIAANKLANIPGVQKFECLKQTSKKNKFKYGISMEFASTELYEQYSNHPDHVKFVQEYWIKEIDDFLEIDYAPISK